MELYSCSVFAGILITITALDDTCRVMIIVVRFLVPIYRINQNNLITTQSFSAGPLCAVVLAHILLLFCRRYYITVVLGTRDVDGVLF